MLERSHPFSIYTASLVSMLLLLEDFSPVTLLQTAPPSLASLVPNFTQTPTLPMLLLLLFTYTTFRIRWIFFSGAREMNKSTRKIPRLSRRRNNTFTRDGHTHVHTRDRLNHLSPFIKKIAITARTNHERTDPPPNRSRANPRHFGPEHHPRHHPAQYQLPTAQSDDSNYLP